MALLTYAFPFWAGVAPGPWANNLAARLQGWRQLGVGVGAALGEVPRPKATFILTFNRQLTSELAFYVPGQPKVYTWRVPEGEPQNQYDIWDGPKIGWDALIVVPVTDSSGAAHVSGYFQAVRRLDDASLGSGNRRYRLYLGTSLREWPAKNRTED
jgi:hypothetical protein